MSFKKNNLLGIYAIAGIAIAGILVTVGAFVYGELWVTVSRNMFWGHPYRFSRNAPHSMIVTLASVVIYWATFLISFLTLWTSKNSSRSWVFSTLLILDVIAFILSIIYANPIYGGFNEYDIIFYVIGFVFSILGNALWFGLIRKKEKDDATSSLNKDAIAKANTNNATSRLINYKDAYVLLIIATCIMGWALITLLWLIPMIIFMKRAINEVNTPSEQKHTALGVCTILFVNGILGIISGILCLVASASFNPLGQSDNAYEKSDEEKELERKIRIAKLKKQLRELENEDK